MYDKYENKENKEKKYIQDEISNQEIDKNDLYSNNNINKKIDIEQNNIYEATIQPKCVFTKQSNNLCFYQSTSKKNNQYSTKNLSPLPCINNSENKNDVQPYPVPQVAFWEEKFSCNYTALKPTDDQKKKNSNIERVNLDQFVNSKYKKPQRTIKSYKKNFNIQKSDTNINKISSYKQVEYDSDINLNLNRPRIIYKKKEIDENAYPNNKNYLTESETKQDGIIEKYQTDTLKSQSFFGSFQGTKRTAKSTSKIKVNQLKDFNIDKLIEIGDKYANLEKPVLPLGEIMNNNIMYNNRLRNQKNEIQNYKNLTNYSYEIQNISQFSKFNKENNIDSDKDKVNLMKSNKRIAKKVIHKNLKNSNTLKDENKRCNQDIDFNIINKNNTNNKIQNKSNRTTVYDIQKKKSKKNPKVIYQNNFDKTNPNPNIHQNMAPNELLYKKIANVNKSQKNYEINPDNINLEKNNVIINNGNKKNLLYEQKISDDENNYRNKVINNKKRIIQNKEILEAESKKYNNNNNRVSSNNYYKDTQIKNYYGYDERHNLEDTIDNNAYFESVHSKKKNNNFIIQKAI